jgi:hypothetical protein
VIHIAVDAVTGEIVACVLTDSGADNAGQVPALLRQVECKIASVTVDGAYDGEPVYRTIADRQPDPVPDIVIPPRASAVPGTETTDGRRQRDRHIGLIAEGAAWAGREKPVTAGAASQRRARASATCASMCCCGEKAGR